MIDIAAAMQGLTNFLGGKYKGRADEQNRQSDLQTADIARQAQQTQMRATEQVTAASTQDMAQSAEKFAAEAPTRQLMAQRPKALAVEEMSTQINNLMDGFKSGTIQITPATTGTLNEMMGIRNNLLSELTGVAFPVVTVDPNSAPSPQYLQSVAEVLSRQNVDEVAARTGKDRKTYLTDMGKTLGLSYEVMEALADPGYGPEEKADLLGIQMKLESDARNKGMDAVFEVLKNPSILQYGQSEATVGLQKQAIIQALIGNGVDEDEATMIAMNFPVLTDAIPEAKKAEIRTTIWAKKMDFSKAEMQEEMANYRAKLQAETAVKTTAMRGQVDLNIANLNNLTKVQLAQTAGVDAADIPKARKGILDALTQLTSPAPTTPLTPAKISQLKGVLANNMSTVFRDQYQLDMPPKAVASVLDQVLVPKTGAGKQVASAFRYDRWPILKAEMTKQYIAGGGKDANTINYILKAIFDEFGFGEGGAVYGPPAMIGAVKKPTAKPTTKPKPKGISGGAH